jgi:hypothetical protein
MADYAMTTMRRGTVTPADTFAQDVNAAIAAANQRIQAAVPSIGTNPLQRLMDMVAQPKFVEIIRIANRQSKKHTRTVRGVAVSMDPTPAADNNRPALIRPTLAKLRTLAAWMTLARFAPVTLTRATAQWLVDTRRWTPAQFNNAVSNLRVQLSAAGGAVAQAAYAESIRLWHLAWPQPRAKVWGSSGTTLITSGPLYDTWVTGKAAAKPPTPAGLTTLSGGIFGGEAGLHGLSGSALKRAYRAMHGLGEDAPQEYDWSSEGGGDETGGGTPDTNAGGAEREADTKGPNSASQGAAGETIPPAVMSLVTLLMSLGLAAGAKGATDLITQGPPGMQQPGSEPEKAVEDAGTGAGGLLALGVAAGIVTKLLKLW